MLTTKINNKWSMKMLIFIFFLDLLGVWGLVDATMMYPARGQASAEWSEREYLDAAQKSGVLLLASVGNPVETHAALAAQENDLMQQAGGQGTSMVALRAKTKLKKLEWLRALSVIGQLDPSHTHFDDAQARLDELTTAQANQNAPKPLAAFDIPMQWVFVALGFGGGGWLLSMLVLASRRKYRYDPETLTLTLPDGRTITPSDIAELDKSKWDKFLVTLRLKEGAKVRLDLLRYAPLEEWVLDMEKLTDGYEPEPEAESATETNSSAESQSGDSASEEPDDVSAAPAPASSDSD